MNLKKIVENAPSEIKKEFVYKDFKKDSLIISPSQTIENLYIQVDGTIEVYNQNMAGSFFLYSVDEGYTCFGEVELFIEGLKPLNVLAKTDCRIILLKKETVMKWMKLDFDFNLMLFKYMALKLNKNSDKMAQIAFMTVKDRVLYSLYTHHKFGDLQELSKERLSSEACAPLRSVNRALSKLVDAGFVLYEKKKFSICNTEEIEAHLEEILE
jgi:CRP-like cAMP-binding protein